MLGHEAPATYETKASCLSMTEPKKIKGKWQGLRNKHAKKPAF
ncbi:hypothetical protein [Pedobacter miscanthi]|jgi:hypothetical protein|nr:hypothetical protein [Pedobacter miscanthi]